MNNGMLKQIPKRYRGIVTLMTTWAYNQGRALGNSEGKAEAKIEFQKNNANLRAEIAMTMQRLGDANAQMTINFAKLLERL